ncbi:MAG: hypothetical protein ABMA64_14720 [Myxococcota bacterium]
MFGLWMWALAACHHDFGGCGAPQSTDDVVVDWDGQVPVFDWEPGTVRLVEVEQQGDEVPLWHFQCGGWRDVNTFDEVVCATTPIAYGAQIDSESVHPDLQGPPRELQPGVSYQVRLYTLTQDDGPDPELPGLLAWLGGSTDDRWCGTDITGETTFEVPWDES